MASYVQNLVVCTIFVISLSLRHNLLDGWAPRKILRRKKCRKIKVVPTKQIFLQIFLYQLIKEDNFRHKICILIAMKETSYFQGGPKL